MQEKVLPPSHPRLGLSYYNLGTLYARQQRPLVAVKYLRLALHAQSQGNGRPTLATLRTLTNLATAYFEAENYSLALDYYREALRGAETIGRDATELAERIEKAIETLCAQYECSAQPSTPAASADGY